MITSLSYFKGLTNISNAEDTAPNSNLLGNVSEAQLFLEEYERDVLTKSLGYSLYKDLKSNLETLSGATVETVKSSAAQKYKDLMSGKEYTIDGVLVHWRGLLFTEGALKRSLITYYTFFYFLESDLSRHSGIGLQTEKGKNSKKADPRPKALRAWSKFYELTVESRDNEKSLYQFIEDMNKLDSSTYPDWRPYEFGRRNLWSI